MNKLYYGDNLTVMQHRMGKDSVDLIYLDPPFNSKRSYNLMYTNMTGMPVPEQVEAFCDTWEMDADKERAAREMPVLLREYGVDDYYVEFWRLWMKALRNTQPRLLAYLIYMVERLLHMRSILRPTGSIYLHCDPTASHYIKVMMDGIFGHNNFRNEIVWKRSHAHNSARRWGPIHDSILFYTKSDNYTWNQSYQPYEQEYLDSYFKFDDKDGRGKYWTGDITGAGTRNGPSGESWRGFDVRAKGRHWACSPEELERLDGDNRIYWPPTKGAMPKLKRYLSEAKGIPVQDIILDVPSLQKMSAAHSESLGYPTQKPVGLLKRIIEVSSNPGEVVFDPFCGCGTTIYAAQATGREWIGCDIAILSIKLVKIQLEKQFGLMDSKDYKLSGIPVSVEQAELLFKESPSHFQNWLVERIGGLPSVRKSADRGIDGKMYFETKDGFKEIVLSVKGGHIRPTDIRDLRGVLEREENAEMAGFLSLKEPTKAMRDEAAQAGNYEYAGRFYPRIQLLTVREILEDKKLFDSPTRIGLKGVNQMSLAV